MKRLTLLSVMILFSSLAFGQNLELVKRQMIAYNNHDVETYASFFHDDIEVYNYPDTPLTASKGALINTTSANFSERFPRAELLSSMEINNKVITLEKTQVKLGNARQQFEVVKIYEFSQGKIRRMTFLN